MTPINTTTFLTPPPTVPHSRCVSISTFLPTVYIQPPSLPFIPNPNVRHHEHGRQRSHADMFDCHSTSQEVDDGEHKDKRRRLTKSKPLPLAVPQTTSPNKEPGSGSGSGPSTGESSQNQTNDKKIGHPASPANLAANPPVGFAASREARRGEGYDVYGAVPSPVVMGFDFKTIDGEQLKTVIHLSFPFFCFGPWKLNSEVGSRYIINQGTATSPYCSSTTRSGWQFGCTTRHTKRIFEGTLRVQGLETIRSSVFVRRCSPYKRGCREKKGEDKG